MDTEGSGNPNPPKVFSGKEISGYDSFFLLAAFCVLIVIVQIIWEIVSYLWTLSSKVIVNFCLENKRPQTTARATTLSQLKSEDFVPESANFPRSPGFMSGHPEFFITVDATPTTGRAIFRSPKNNIVYFYSVDWSEFYKFPSPSQQPDKFEMLNTLIALDVYFRCIHGTYGEQRLIIQTDNNFALTTKPRMNSANPGQQLLQTIIRKLEEIGLQYDLQHVTTNDSSDMKAADVLCRGRIDAKLHKLLLESNSLNNDLGPVAFTSMRKLTACVPREYLKL